MPDNCDYSDFSTSGHIMAGGRLKSAYCGWSASYSTQLPEIKIKKHAEKYVDCCQEKKLTMSIV